MQVIEIPVHQGQVKTARTKPNDQHIVHYSRNHSAQRTSILLKLSFQNDTAVSQITLN